MAIIRVKDTTDDYLVAGRGMHPALAALSAVSTWNLVTCLSSYWIHVADGLLNILVQ